MCEYGDETELEYLYDAAIRESERFGTWTDGWGNYNPPEPKPARWLNPPRRIKEANG